MMGAPAGEPNSEKRPKRGSMSGIILSRAPSAASVHRPTGIVASLGYEWFDDPKANGRRECAVRPSFLEVQRLTGKVSREFRYCHETPTTFQGQLGQEF